MDVLISTSEPEERVSRRYDHPHSLNALWMGYASSGNLTVIEQEETAVAMAAGTLFGPLARAERLQAQSPQALGKAALASDGSFAVAIPHGETITVVTDAGGSLPVYYGHGPDGWAVGTLVHHVASASGLTSLDRVSVVDYLLNGTVCYPYSWYEDVRLLPPGSVCTIDRGGMDRHTYWTPAEPDHIHEENTEREWGKRLRRQVRNAVERSLADQRTSRVLYSGGLDSRAVLSLVPDSFPCTPTLVLDRKNREYRLAHRSARLLGRTLEWIARPDEFYRSSIEERIDRIGPGWDFQHTHIFGNVADRFQDVDVLLGGYAADSLFKTLYMSNVEERRRQPPRLLGPAPGWIHSPKVWGGTLGNAALWSEAAAAAQERHIEHHERLKEHRPLTAGNWHLLWPVGNLFAYGNYLACLRMAPRLVEPFLFHQTYRLAAQMPDPCRVDCRAFRHAFAEPMGAAGLWPTSDGRIPRLGGYPGSLTAYYIDRWRFWKDRLGASVGRQGSWPADHEEGWTSIRPDAHFPEDNRRLLRHRLDALLADGQAACFFRNDDLPNRMRVRALALAFDGP